MKKFILFLALALSFSAGLSAQTAVSYKEMKADYTQYMKTSGMPYSPAWMGITSFAVPGLGQLIARENRGWYFLGGSFVCGILIDCGGQTFMNNVLVNSDGSLSYVDKKKAGTGLGIFVAAAMCQLGISIWSCCDAVKVAKVKNMYYAKKNYSLDVHPSLEMVGTGNGYAAAPGMGVALKF